MPENTEQGRNMTPEEIADALKGYRRAFPPRKLTLSKRDTQEIQHSIYYAEKLAHGTAGHNQLMLIAALAKYIGFGMGPEGDLEFPEDIPVALVESSR
jgi:hypothetical protein